MSKVGPDYKSLIRSYRRKYSPYRRKELSLFARQESIVAVITKACGEKTSHRRRFKKTVLKEFARRVLSVKSAVRKCGNFKDLYDVIFENKIKGIGRLTVYDSALHIGAYKGLKPKEIYLHRGAKAGAKVIGIYKRGARTLKMEDMPGALCRLKPYEIEDFLCIYKKELSGKKSDKFKSCGARANNKVSCFTPKRTCYSQSKPH